MDMDALTYVSTIMKYLFEIPIFKIFMNVRCSWLILNLNFEQVAMRCKDRLHELVKEELEDKVVESMDWKEAMERSFSSMDSEVVACKEGVLLGASCRCELQAPESDAVGSTAVVALVTPEKIIVANCGDSRAVLCRNGKAIPLSTDHKVSIS